MQTVEFVADKKIGTMQYDIRRVSTGLDINDFEYTVRRTESGVLLKDDVALNVEVKSAESDNEAIKRVVDWVKPEADDEFDELYYEEDMTYA